MQICIPKDLPTKLKIGLLIHGTCLKQLVPQCPNGDFLFPSFLLIYCLVIFCREDGPLTSHLFVNVLIISVWIHGHFLLRV